LVQNRIINFALLLFDAILRLTIFRSGQEGLTVVPNRILIANGAHLGDVVLATAVLQALKSAFPKVKIGVLIGSWSHAVILDHPLVDWIHTVDHWKLNRSGNALWLKWRQYLGTRAKALKEIRSIGYDVAIDLYYFFPNSVLLLWQLAIPMRIGYTSGGLGPLLTHPVDWKNQDISVVQYHAELLRRLGLESQDLELLRPTLPAVNPERSAAFTSVLGFSSKYLVLHLGTGHKLKEWPMPKWRQLVEYLVSKGCRLVFTGAGAKEHREIEGIIHGLPNCHNLCGLLDWQAFVSTLSQARIVIGVDSIAGHIAAAVGTPSVIIGNGISNPHHWRPQSENCTVLMHEVPCAPCYRKQGCEGMECVQGISAGDVIAEVFRALDY
jgi:ADP-heptose:LPS heptosyltransferase